MFKSQCDDGIHCNRLFAHWKVAASLWETNSKLGWLLVPYRKSRIGMSDIDSTTLQLSSARYWMSSMCRSRFVRLLNSLINHTSNRIHRRLLCGGISTGVHELRKDRTDVGYGVFRGAFEVCHSYLVHCVLRTPTAPSLLVTTRLRSKQPAK